MKRGLGTIGIVVAIFIAMLPVATGTAFLVNHGAKTALAKAAATIADQAKQLTELTKEKNDLTLQVVALAKQGAMLQQGLIDLQHSAAVNAAAFQAQINALKTAQPNVLVAKAIQVLGVTDKDIVYNGTSVVFTLEAFRKQVTVDADWEDFSLNREPNYKSQIVNQASQIGNLNQQMLVKDQIIANQDKQIASHQAIENAFKDQVSAQKRESLFSKIETCAISGAVGAVGGWLAHGKL